jgi:hypothetical protein
MKNSLSIIFIAALIVAGSAIKVSAQNRPEETSSARAAYGVMPESGKYKTKKKKDKLHKHKHTHAKANKIKSPAYRKRENWAG